MNEKTLIIVCLLTSLIGIVLMFLSNSLFKPNISKISEIDKNMNSVIIKGELIDIKKSKSGTFFLKIEDTSGIINVVVFKNSIKNMKKIKKGDLLTIQGKPEIYKNSLEIIANKITQNPL